MNPWPGSPLPQGWTVSAVPAVRLGTNRHQPAAGLCPGGNNTVAAPRGDPATRQSRPSGLPASLAAVRDGVIAA